MNTSLWPTIAIAAVLTLGASAQDDASAKKRDPEVKEKVDDFKKAIRDRKFERDSEAIGIIDDLLSRYDSLHEKDQEIFVRALGDVWKAKARKPDNIQLYHATSTALGVVGEKGAEDAAKILVKAFDKKPFDDRDYVALREIMLENIGRTKGEKQVEFLTERARRDPEDRIKAKAGYALRHFDGADQKVRKEIVKELLIDYTKIEGDAASIDPGNATAQTRKRTLQAIADPWNTALGALTGADFRKAAEWQHWFNKNKNKDWDKK